MPAPSFPAYGIQESDSGSDYFGLLTHSKRLNCLCLYFVVRNCTCFSGYLRTRTCGLGYLWNLFILYVNPMFLQLIFFFLGSENRRESAHKVHISFCIYCFQEIYLMIP